MVRWGLAGAVGLGSVGSGAVGCGVAGMAILLTGREVKGK